MSEWAVFFLGIMALMAVIQCVFVVVTALSVRGSGQRISELCGKFDSEIKPALEDLRKGASNLRAISDSGREQAARVEALLSTTMDSLEMTIEHVRSKVVQPLESLNDLSAFWGGLKSGFDRYRATPRKRGGSSSRRSEDSDEHMFIG